MKPRGIDRQSTSLNYVLVLRKKMETLKLEMQREHERVSVVLNMEVDKKLKMEDHQIHGWGFRLSRNVRILFMSTCSIQLWLLLKGEECYQEVVKSSNLHTAFACVNV